MSPSVVQVTLGPDDAARRLLEARGYREARRHLRDDDRARSGRRLGRSSPTRGIRDSSGRPTRASWYAAANEIFEDEWSFDLGTFDEWWRLRSSDDHTLWFLARDGAEIVGILQAEYGRRGGGLVHWVGVCKPWRRRGVGRALLLQAFGELHARGATRVGLGVDAENPSQATRLYESVGMYVEADHATFLKEL